LPALHVARRSIPTVVLGLLLVPTLAAGPSQAAPKPRPIAVDSLADPGIPGDRACALREAVANANEDSDTSGGDCRPGLGVDSIMFSVAGTITIHPQAGVLSVTDPDGLTLDGGDEVTVSGANAVGIFSVPLGSSLSLRNLSVTGGSAAVGGGVHNGGTVTVLNSRFSSNTATYAGGSIENDGGAITVIDSMFSGSSATAGGAIDSEGGTVTVTNSSFSGNHATAGGGIEMYAGKLDVASSTFSDNHATSGGGVDNDFGTGDVTNSTFSGNSATSGAGISNFGTLTVANSTFSDNHANFGGGIGNDDTLSVTNSTFSGNDAGFGGGIENSDATTTVTNSTFSRNHAANSGGGMDSIGGTVTVTNSTFSGNRAGFGGGIRNEGAMTVTNSTLSGNGAIDGGGIANEEERAVFTVLSSIVAANSGWNCIGPISDGGYNLEFTRFNGTNRCGFSKHAVSANPRLGALRNNGGPTKTMALRTESPAIDAIPPGSHGCGKRVAADQRGVARPQSEGCDIGAFEVELVDLGIVVAASPNPVKRGRQLTYTITVHNFALFTSATNLSVVNTFPAQSQFVSVSGPGWTCQSPDVGETGTMTCVRPTLAAGANATIEAVVTVSAPKKTMVIDSATVSSSTPDPNPANNSASVAVLVK
jgi:uncharacterized repeat protein (TIGR01451 family)